MASKCCKACGRKLARERETHCSRECRAITDAKEALVMPVCPCGKSTKESKSKYCSQLCSSSNQKAVAAQAFDSSILSKIEKEDVADGCWIWKGSVDSQGYGIYGLYKKGKSNRASRLVYEMFKEPVPQGTALSPNCTNRYCINPEHQDQITTKDIASRRKSKITVKRIETE